MRLRLCLLLTASMLLSAPAALAAGGEREAALLQAQRQALAPLAILDGEWRGSAKVWTRDGKVIPLTQTERVGPFLGGAIRLIEGRGYAEDGTLHFNAFAVLSYVPQEQKYKLRSYAQGHEGDFPLEVRPDGFSWSIQAGPALIRYTATVKDGVWTEVGERIVDGQPPVRMFEMTLRRLGSTGWPAAGAVQAR